MIKFIGLLCKMYYTTLILFLIYPNISIIWTFFKLRIRNSQIEKHFNNSITTQYSKCVLILSF